MEFIVDSISLFIKIINLKNNSKFLTLLTYTTDINGLIFNHHYII